MGAGREHAPTQVGGGHGGGAPRAQDGVAGASAQGQAAEIMAAANATELRSAMRVAALEAGDVFAGQGAHEFPVVGPDLPDSHFMIEAQRSGRVGPLNAWARLYDGARTPYLQLAHQMGELDLLKQRGVDWQRPGAHAGEIGAMSGLAADPTVSAAKATDTSSAETGSIHGWLAAYRAVDAKRAGVEAAALLAKSASTMGQAKATEGQIEAAEAKAGQSGIEKAVGLLNDIHGLISGGIPKTLGAALKSVNDGLSKLGITEQFKKQREAEIAALRVRLGELKAASDDARIQAAHRSLTQAVGEYQAALEALKAAADKMQAGQGARRRKAANVGTALDEQRAPGSGAPNRGTGANASDRATALFLVAEIVEMAAEAADVSLSMFADLSGPDLLEALLDQAGGRAGSAYLNEWFSTAHMPTLRVAQAGGHHQRQRDSLLIGRAHLAKAAEGWRLALGPLRDS